MTKKAKLPLMIVGGVVAVILIAVIVLCCITVSPMKQFYEYDSVVVLDTDGSRLAEFSDEQKSTFDEALDDTGFSVMHAWMEFVYGFSPKFDTVKDEDGNDVKNELTYSQVQSAAVANSSTYLVELRFSQPTTYRVQKEDVAYNTVLMQVYTTSGEVQKITVYVYDSTMVGLAGNPDSEDYRITPIRVRANLTKLYNALDRITGKTE